MKNLLLKTACIFALAYTPSCAAKSNTDHTHSMESTSKSEAKGRYFSARITRWAVGPEVSGDSISEINNSCEIEITTPSGGIPESTSIQAVFPFMKVHGHGAPDEQITTSLQGNKLTVSKIAFTMSGPWELHIQATVDGKYEELEIPVVVP